MKWYLVSMESLIFEEVPETNVLLIDIAGIV